MDPDVKAALVALTESQQRTDTQLATLTESQQRTDTQLATLTQRVDGLAERVDGLNATMSVLASAQVRTEERMAEGFVRLVEAQERTEARMQWFAEQLLRGSTDAAERHGEVIERLDRLERR